MSNAITFDTLAFVKTLEASGIDPKQAEAIQKAVGSIFEENLSNKIFTKDDGRSLKSEIKEEISKLREDIQKIKIDILVWVVGIILAQSGLILGMIKLFH